MQYHLLKFISRIVCLLPYRFLLRLGAGLGRLYYLAAKPQRERAKTQLQERMDLSPAEADQIVRRMFINLAQTVLEVLYTPRLNAANISNYAVLENRHYLDEALAKGKGVAILAAHFGNWEWLGASLALYGYPLAAVATTQRNEQYMRLLSEYRQQAGIEIYAKGSNEIVGLIKAFKRGQAVGLISDQNAGKTGITLDFFGKPASTHSGVSIFAAKFDCPVVPIFSVRSPKGGHRILIQPPHYFEHTGRQAEDITNFTARMSKEIENIIRRYPDHWLWFHKRWRNPEQGRPASGGERQ